MEGKQAVIFSIPWLPYSLNQLFRMHWAKRKTEQLRINNFMLEQWHKHDRIKFLKPIKVHYAIYFGSNRYRDYDNYIGGTKLFNDAIKETFTHRDDSSWIVDLSVSFHKGSQQTVVSIEEAL